jgi:hypothetical protein
MQRRNTLSNNVARDRGCGRIKDGVIQDEDCVTSIPVAGPVRVRFGQLTSGESGRVVKPIPIQDGGNGAWVPFCFVDLNSFLRHR